MTTKNFIQLKDEVADFLKATQRSELIKNLKESTKTDYLFPFLVSKPYFIRFHIMKFQLRKVQIEFGFILDFVGSYGSIPTPRYYIEIEREKKPKNRFDMDIAIFLFDISREEAFLLKLLQTYKITYIVPSFFHEKEMVDFALKVERSDTTIDKIKEMGETIRTTISNEEWEREWIGALKQYTFDLNGTTIYIEARSRKESEDLLIKQGYSEQLKNKTLKHHNATVIDDKATIKPVKPQDWEMIDYRLDEAV